MRGACCSANEGACIFWSFDGRKNVVPVADEAARRRTGEGVAFANEMGLIEVAELVDDVGPRSARCVAAGDQCAVETDGSREQLWRHADLRRETALELT